MSTGIHRMLNSGFFQKEVLPILEKKYPIDADKLKGEMSGDRRPDSHNAFVLGAQEELRLHPETQPTPEPTFYLFEKKYAFVRGPRSGSETEKMAELKKAGYDCVAFNVADYEPTAWGGWIALAQKLEMHYIPWARTITLSNVTRLISIAQKWGSPGLIINLEQNSGMPRWNMTGEQVGACFANMNYEGQIGVSTEPYLPGNFNWLPLILMKATCLPQTSITEFPNYPPEKVVERVADPAQFNWNDPYPVPSLGTYTPLGKEKPTRSMYIWNKNFGIYTVDNCAISEIASWV